MEAATPAEVNARTGSSGTVIEAEAASEPAAPVPVVDAPADEPSTRDAPSLSHPTGTCDDPAEDVRRRVLDLYAAGGLSGRQIAKTVGVSEAAVRRYRDKYMAEIDGRELRSA